MLGPLPPDSSFRALLEKKKLIFLYNCELLFLLLISGENDVIIMPKMMQKVPLIIHINRRTRESDYTHLELQ